LFVIFELKASFKKSFAYLKKNFIKKNFHRSKASNSSQTRKVFLTGLL